MYKRQPLYRVVYAEPQIPRSEELENTRIIDSKNRRIAALVMHTLIPMNKEGYFADLMGNSIPEGRLKEYYDELNKELIKIKKILLKKKISSLEDLEEKIDPQEAFFAGFGPTGGKIKIPFKEWWVRFSDSEFAPTFARIHKRIISAYVRKEGEPDNIVYELFYKENVKNFRIPEDKIEEVCKMYD